MINSIKANGFRSLTNQVIKIESGINAFVGPNGAGKTNILTAIDFIANLIDDGPAIAINKAGGITGVFQRKPSASPNDQEIKKSISFSVDGNFVVQDEYTEELGHDFIIYAYKYDFILRINKHNIPYLSSQLLNISAVGDEGGAFDEPIIALKVKQTSKGGFSVSKASAKYIHSIRTEIINTDEDLIKYLNNIIINDGKWKNSCIFEQLSHILFLVWLTRKKLTHSERLAIKPDKIKLGDDITSPLEISNDGSGTIRTLHALKNGYWGEKRNKRHCEEIFKEIINELRLAVENIQDIVISEDTATARYTLNFLIKSNNNELINIPANFASEGTLKWLVIITFIKTGSIFSLEEPENFLHPWMQIELIRLLREQNEKNPLNSILLSTHSETLLNELKPDEIIITSMRNGLTKATRVKNKKSLEKEINNTGFSLGYYYVSGALDYE